MRRRKRGAIFWVSLLMFAAALALLGSAVWGLVTPVGAGPPLLISVEQGESVTEVASALWERGLIRNANALVGAAYVTGKWRCVQAGRHELDASMSALDMLDALCRGSRTAWHWITIPEGYSLGQIAEKVEGEGLGGGREFLAATRSPHRFEVVFPAPRESLEGYLFPDTYRVDAGEAEDQIVAQMLRRFEEVVWKGLFEERGEHDGRSLRDILILASMVEWEAQLDEERSTIAGVLLNRLKRGQKLECDATVQYALGEGRKSRLMYEDLMIESDYNTYQSEGLPPGPICSPGEASIRAAMDPAEVPYLYYVARPDGSHVFSRTFAEHQTATARVRRESRGGRG
ncbi:MAG TPA: endolytic transglycosylase MltG [Armatimonadota bacterium]|nr:endolytic transglycosylase MltG [Armatimonadota bacterium]